MRVIRSAVSLITRVSPQKPGLFIDCGANIGQGFSYFSRFYKPSRFDYLLIEPNPACIDLLSRVVSRIIPSNQAHIINKAAACANGTASFYGLSPKEGGALSQGASLDPHHNSRYYAASKSSAIQVPTFSLSQLITQHAYRYPIIILKLDVEGAEYDILPHLISTQAIKLINHLYVEFHPNDVKEPLRHARLNKQAEILKTLDDLSVPYTLWT